MLNGLGDGLIEDRVDSFSKYSHVRSKLVVGTLGEGRPEVSIVIPTYNRPQMLREAVNSALSQKTGIEFEVVVVDNCQDPKISSEVDELIRSYGNDRLLLYRNEENIGMFGNWNRAIDLARGKWLTILNDDDRLKIGWLMAVERNREGRGFVGVRANVFGEMPKTPLPTWLLWVRSGAQKVSRIRCRKKLSACDYFEGHPFYGSLGVFFEKESLMNLGGYDESYWPSSDYVLSYFYWKKHGGVILNEALCEYRWEDNASKRIDVLCGFVDVTYLVRFHMASVCSSDLIGRCAKWVAKRKALIDVQWYQLRFGVEFNAVGAPKYLDGHVPQSVPRWRLLISRLFYKSAGFVLCSFL